MTDLRENENLEAVEYLPTEGCRYVLPSVHIANCHPMRFKKLWPNLRDVKVGAVQSTARDSNSSGVFPEERLAKILLNNGVAFDHRLVIFWQLPGCSGCGESNFF